MLGISTLFAVLWVAVARDRQLLKPEVSDEEVNAILLATSPNVGFYVGVTLLAIIAPRVAAFGFLVIAVVGVLRARADEMMAEPVESA